VSREEHIKEISRWIIDSDHVVAFTGAGISTDSGIPDFRGPDGVWTRRDAGLPAPKWRVARDRVVPNASHLSLVELQQLGKLQFLITQNTDNLHRRSGIRPELLAELHGNGQLMRCTDCGNSYTREEADGTPAGGGQAFARRGPYPGSRIVPSAAAGSSLRWSTSETLYRRKSLRSPSITPAGAA
jgi:NAD-dependent SIR2 family protein deacetylase